MNLDNLSVNWKKLQNLLSLEKQQEPRYTLKENGSTTTSRTLKRKASTAPKAGPTVKRPKFSNSHLEKPIFAKKARKMGGLISSNSKLTIDLDQAKTDLQTSSKHLQASGKDVATSEASQPLPHAGRYIALDCEMVGTNSLTAFSVVQRTDSGNEYSIIARVSLVSYDLETVYDAYVLPPSDIRISDYRTIWSGITPWHLNPANPDTKPKPFEDVQKEVAAILEGRILVGHALRNDLAVLGLSHPKRMTRDTARYPPFREMAATPGRNGTIGKARAPALRRLAKDVLGWDIQGDDRKGHSSVEDARAAMALFQREKTGFENENAKLFGRHVVPKASNSRSRHAEGEGNEEEDVVETSMRRRKKKKKKKQKG